MLIRAGYEITFECLRPTPMLLMLNVHPSRVADLRTPQVMRFDPVIPSHDYDDRYGNIVTRILAPPGRITISADFHVEDSGLPDAVFPDAEQVPVDKLPDDAMVFLLGSRYCEIDLLSDTAWSLFGDVTPGWARVQAICDHVHQQITFGYAHARNTRTAREAYIEQKGVCRDFAHLAVALCRCMNIPARYCTGYLGDIGVPVSDTPMDFSGWFDVYLGGQWITCDARHNKPRIGRILMGRGRDATDVAISTQFDRAALIGFKVITDEITS